MMNQLNETQQPISQLLQTLTSSSWQQQIQIISSLIINPQLIKLINHRNYSSELASLFASHNPRTKLITTLSQFLIELFSNYSNQLIPFANLLISNKCLLRLLGSGNKVVSSAVNQIMKCIIGNIDFRTKAKQVKFVTNLENQFLCSKNTYLRQKISLYFLLISTSFYYNTRDSLADFERKVVKQGLQDASEKVRTNMKQILENIHHFQKENQIVLVQQKALSRKSREKVTLKNSNTSQVYRQNKSLKALNSSSLNQSSIVDSFVQRDKSSKKDPEPIDPQWSDQSYRFYIQQLKSTSAWSMISIAYEALTQMIRKGYLFLHGNDQLYCQTIKTLTPFLNQKRSKIYQSCAVVYRSLLQEILIQKKNKVIVFCQEHTPWIVQHLVKNQNSQLIKATIALNPTFFIPKIAEISVSVKIIREKLILLDAIVVNLPKIIFEPTAKGNKRIGSMVRAMCQHIQTATLKEKEVSLAALAVISQLKQKYAQEVLTALLCQNDKTLSKILDVAQSIDLSLKQAIIEYINSLKGSNRKNNQKQLKIQRKNLSQMIEVEMLLICQQKSTNLNRLGQIILTHAGQLECKQFISILCLLQFLCTSDLIMEYKILMEQISKLPNQQFTNAIIELLTAQAETEQAKVREFHDILLLQLLANTLKQQQLPHQDKSKIVKCLIHVYRSSDWSVKKRSIAIELLSNIEEQCLTKQVREDERQLIEAFRCGMLEQLTI